MAYYYVNKNQQSKGDHEVHKQDYSWLPLLENRIYLGHYLYCTSAVRKAKEYYKSDERLLLLLQHLSYELRTGEGPLPLVCR